RPRPLRDGRLDRGRVKVPRPPVDVREDRRRALEDEAVRRCRERDGRRDRLVAGPEPGRPCQQMQPRGSARDGRRIRRPDPVCDQLLEAIDRRPEREPPGAQHLEYELFFALVEKRPRQRDFPQPGAAQASAGAGAAYSSHWAQRSLRPRPVSRYASWIASVIAPTPISTSSTARSGVTSAAVPVMKASSA